MIGLRIVEIPTGQVIASDPCDYHTGTIRDNELTTTHNEIMGF